MIIFFSSNTWKSYSQATRSTRSQFTLRKVNNRCKPDRSSILFFTLVSLSREFVEFFYCKFLRFLPPFLLLLKSEESPSSTLTRRAILSFFPLFLAPPTFLLFVHHFAYKIWTFTLLKILQNRPSHRRPYHIGIFAHHELLNFWLTESYEKNCEIETSSFVLCL